MGDSDEPCKVAVGTVSQYKLDAVAQAFSLIELDVRVEGISVSSGVSNQPMSADECIEGARNRAVAAMNRSTSECACGIGIENGLVSVASQWYATTWIVAVNDDGAEGVASTIFRPVPPSLMRRIEEGHELSDAIRLQHGLNSNASKAGLIGLITGGVLVGRDVLCDGIITAMSPLLNRALFE